MELNKRFVLTVVAVVIYIVAANTRLVIPPVVNNILLVWLAGASIVGAVKAYNGK